jgi:predicted TIM-barrel fold metal-dependent hydrolase
MIIDANAYLGFWPYWRMEADTPDKALVSSLRSIFFDAEDGNRELLAACEKYPDAFYGLATLGPLFKREETGFQELSTGTFRGIRIYPIYHGFSLISAKEIYDVAEEFRVPIVVPYRLISSWALPSLAAEEAIATAKEYPKVTFVISGFNYEEVGNLLRHRYPKNVYAETSGLQVVDGTEILLDSLGDDHVMLGTGLPASNPRSGIQKVLRSGLDKKRLDAVAWGNAASLFGIKA